MRQLLLTLVCLSLFGLAGCQSFPQTAAAIQAQQQDTPALPIQRWRTQAGSEVLFVANHTLPMLDIQLTFAAGASRDGQVVGLASLTNSLLGEDTQSGLDSSAIARGFESLGSEFGNGSYRDMAIMHLRSLTDPAYLDPSMTLFTQVLAPAFKAANITRIRTQMLQGLKMEEAVPGPAASKTYMHAIFGDHPYGHPAGGTLASLPTITQAEIKHFYQRYYSAGNVVIALVGDISRKQAEALAERISKALPQGAQAPDLPQATPVTKAQLLHVNFPSSQTHILIGNQAIHRGVKDWPALYVGNWILGGGGFASRLTQQVREQKGYVYGISSSFSPMLAGGPFTISLQTANANAQQALDLTLKVADDFIHQGPTQAEVTAAIDNITGSFPLSIASNGSIVGQLGAIGFYHLPTDYLTQFVDDIRKVTPAMVKTAMQKYVQPQNFTLVSVGPKPLSWPTASAPTQAAGAHDDQQK